MILCLCLENIILQPDSDGKSFFWCPKGKQRVGGGRAVGNSLGRVKFCSLSFFFFFVLYNAFEKLFFLFYSRNFSFKEIPAGELFQFALQSRNKLPYRRSFNISVRLLINVNFISCFFFGW